MKKIIGIFKAKWFWSLVGIIALSVCIWIGGPLIAIADKKPFAAEWVRAVLISSIFLLWILANVEFNLRSNRKNAQLIDELKEDDSIEDPNAPLNSESQALQSRMEEALTLLSKTKLKNKKRFYEIPWYVVIGPPGSGKTTSLVNSGLNFPLAQKFGRGAIEGFGGTKHCDWFFTDEAVMIDTAGRYTSQDSHSQIDGHGWGTFISLLKKYRPRRPMNGILIAFSLTDIATKTEAEITVHAQTIRKRINELQNQMGMRLPVYITFTKADLIEGFVEYFADLSQQQKEQVWGMTFDIDASNSSTNIPQLFMKEYQKLLETLSSRSFGRMHQERSVERRGIVFEFPRQMASLQVNLTRFIAEISHISQMTETPVLRGAYFVSGTQTGNTVNRIVQSLGLNMPTQRKQNSVAQTGSGYFLTQLMRNVIFPESGLAGTNVNFERRQQWLRAGTAVAAFSCVGLSVAGLKTSHTENKQLLSNVDSHISSYFDNTNGGLSADADWQVVNTGLGFIERTPTSSRAENDDDTWIRHLGLYQGNSTNSLADAAYLDAIQNVLLPKVKHELEVQLRQSDGDLAIQYEALKTYLMLFDLTHRDDESLKLWVQLSLNLWLPGELAMPARESLMRHFNTALAEKMTLNAPNDSLVQYIRENLQQMSLAERIYRQILQDYDQNAAPDFRLTDAVGNSISQAYQRKSGRPLSEPIRGLYTYNGFHRIFLPASKQLSEKLTSETWIYGDEQSATVTETQLERAREEVNELYFNDYTYAWQELLNDLEIKPFANFSEASTRLRQLVGPSALFKKLIATVKQQTELNKTAKVAALESIQSGSENSENPLKSQQDRLARLLPAGQVNKLLADQPGTEVAEQFTPIRQLLITDLAGQMPINNIVQTMDELRLAYSRLAMAENPTQDAFQAAISMRRNPESPVVKLEQLAEIQPSPINEWLLALSVQSKSLTTQSARGHINDIWQSDVIPFYRTAIAGKYPIDKQSKIDITPQDFGAFFGPGGILDEFFEAQLAPFVDKKRWRFKTSIGISNSRLQTFKQAAYIKKTFFSNGGTTPNVDFRLAPKSLTDAATQFRIQVHGQLLEYRHGPIKTSAMSWPGPEASMPSRVVFTPANDKRSIGEVKDGYWSFFRLLDEHQIRPLQARNTFAVDLNLNGFTAELNLTASSVDNPFNNNQWVSFNLPSRL